jgi:flagellar motility protein MotE (MotC chaperone)
MKYLHKFRLVPVMLLVAGLAFMVRVGDFVTGLENMGSAQAQQEVAGATPPPMNAAPAGAPAQAEINGRLNLDAENGGVELKQEFQATPSEGAAPDPAATIAKTGEAVQWKDSNDTDIDNSAVKDEIYKDLAKRRELLDKKEKEIGVREALLSAAERELDQKLRELTVLQSEIEASMKKRSDEEIARIASLVKIYEGMKPKDAASILNTLDLDVLLVIMTQMSERKSSPIMAEMNPERARTLTIMMSEQRQKSSIPEMN